MLPVVGDPRNLGGFTCSLARSSSHCARHRSIQEVTMTKLNQIQGLHHVTSLAAGASATNAFFTKTLGLRRVKKTVNFDEPSVYHLYYGDEVGLPGTVMTYFPFPNIAPGRPGVGE